MTSKGNHFGCQYQSTFRFSIDLLSVSCTYRKIKSILRGLRFPRNRDSISHDFIEGVSASFANKLWQPCWWLILTPTLNPNPNPNPNPPHRRRSYSTYFLIGKPFPQNKVTKMQFFLASFVWGVIITRNMCRATQLGQVAALVYCCGFVLWLIDQNFCAEVQSLHFHALWHLLTGAGTYLWIQVLFIISLQLVHKPQTLTPSHAHSFSVWINLKLAIGASMLTIAIWGCHLHKLSKMPSQNNGRA